MAPTTIPQAQPQSLGNLTAAIVKSTSLFAVASTFGYISSTTGLLLDARDRDRLLLKRRF
jgi:hypothetical protein